MKPLVNHCVAVLGSTARTKVLDAQICVAFILVLFVIRVAGVNRGAIADRLYIWPCWIVVALRRNFLITSSMTSVETSDPLSIVRSLS